MEELKNHHITRYLFVWNHLHETSETSDVDNRREILWLEENIYEEWV